MNTEFKNVKKLPVGVNSQAKLKRFNEQNNLNKQINWEILDKTNYFNEN